MFQPIIAVDQGGGKSGAHSYEGVSPTLTCTHGGEPAVVYGIQGSMIGRADKNGPQGDGVNEDVSFTLNTTDRHAVVYGISPYHSNCMKSDNQHSGCYEADTARTLDALQCGYPGCNQGGMAVVQPICFEPGAASRLGGHCYEDQCGTLRATIGDNQPAVAYSIENHPADNRVDIDESGNVPMVLEPTGYDMQAFGKYKDSGCANSLKARDYKDATCLVVAGVDCRNATEYPEMNGTIQAKNGGGFSLNCNQVVRVKHIVRRLTPLECERLQGFPDGWTLLPKIDDMTVAEYEFWKSVILEREKREGRARENENGVLEIWKFVDGEDEDEGEWVNTHKPYKHNTKDQMIGWYNRMVSADSSRYKALGNSIALPPWKWVLKRLCACYERDATMASLFDGIGGFPLIWEQLNGKGSCLWASEIEEFPMAVTKVRFGE